MVYSSVKLHVHAAASVETMANVLGIVRKKKTDVHNFLKFWQISPNTNNGDNLFTQSLPKTS